MRKANTILLLMNCLGQIICSGAKGQSADSSAYNIAFEYYDRGDFDKAIYWFGQSIQSGYKVSKSHEFRGSVKSLKGDLPGALDDLNTALRLDSANTNTYLYLARLYLFKNEFATGLKAIDRAIAGDTTDAHYFDCRAMLYMGLLKYDLALLDADHAIRLDSNSNYINNKGMIRQKMGNYVSAIVDYNLALVSEPDDPTILTNIAFCNFKLDRLNAGLTLCNEVLNTHPNIPYALATRGEIQFALGNKAKACVDFQTLFTLDAKIGTDYIDKYCK